MSNKVCVLNCPSFGIKYFSSLNVEIPVKVTPQFRSKLTPQIQLKPILGNSIIACVTKEYWFMKMNVSNISGMTGSVSAEFPLTPQSTLSLTHI